MNNLEKVMGHNYILFTTSDCPNCKKATEEINKIGLPHKHYNANAKEHKDMVLNLGITSVPCLLKIDILETCQNICGRWDNLSEIIGFCQNFAKKR